MEFIALMTKEEFNRLTDCTNAEDDIVGGKVLLTDDWYYIYDIATTGPTSSIVTLLKIEISNNK